MNFPSRQSMAGTLFFSSIVAIRYSWVVTIIIILAGAGLLYLEKMQKKSC